MGDSLQPLKDFFCPTVFTSRFERTSRGGIVTFSACISLQEPVDTGSFLLIYYNSKGSVITTILKEPGPGCIKILKIT